VNSYNIPLPPQHKAQSAACCFLLRVVSILSRMAWLSDKRKMIRSVHAYHASIRTYTQKSYFKAVREEKLLVVPEVDFLTFYFNQYEWFLKIRMIFGKSFLKNRRFTISRQTKNIATLEDCIAEGFIERVASGSIRTTLKGNNISHFMGYMNECLKRYEETTNLGRNIIWSICKGIGLLILALLASPYLVQVYHFLGRLFQRS